MAQAALHGALIDMFPVGFPDPLAADQPAQQGDGRIGQIIER